tara:strand:- start:1162 stop:3018 length:1857 start_codon:yes stop_codon:yes gene_type:complete
MESKNIKYLNKDFATINQQLIEYAKTYYPNTYSDFTPSSPGMMFMEMASYVGDVLSFYLDNQIQENFMQFARQDANLFNLAYMMGYKPRVTNVSSVEVDFYQQVPSILSGSVYIPDFSYALQLPAGAQVGSELQTISPFLINTDVDFSFSSSSDPTDVTVYSVSGNTPEFFLLKKTRSGVSSTITSKTFTFGSPQQFQTVEINDSNIVSILDVTDSDGNVWYEVDYLAQDVVFDPIRNTNTNDPNFSDDSTDAPYLLRLKQADRRFATRFLSSTTLQLQFGSGVVANNDEAIVPNPDNVGIGLPFEQDKLTTSFSPSNFLFTDSYGISPANTTLTIRYLTGGGVQSNIQSNLINQLQSEEFTFVNSNLNAVTAQYVFNSLQINNPKAADGGGDGDSTEEMRQNAMAQFNSQLRTVTQDDYLVRALSLPSRYGSIAKVYATPKLANDTTTDEKIAALDLYCLSYDRFKNLQTPSEALKNNLKTYLSQYRMVNDAVSIKNGYIINIGVNFEIIVLPNYNSNEVILACISALRGFFNINRWQINQPIIFRDIYVILDQIEGVQTVKNVYFNNLNGVENGYSEYGYDIKGATIDGVLYPSIDPSIFEVKNPNQDIKGRVVSY